MRWTSLAYTGLKIIFILQNYINSLFLLLTIVCKLNFNRHIFFSYITVFINQLIMTNKFQLYKDYTYSTYT